MSAQQRIVRERRQYNQWVASQTLEDYALRYTPLQARKSAFRVGNTALGPIAFLACEAIGGTITLAYGVPNAIWAVVLFSILMFLIGFPIAYYAARYGVDIDLLTRGAGFGYLGSTITSLIYASFTFLLFAIEASILSAALLFVFHIPLPIAHLISSLVVIPIAVYGISLISRMQLFTQPVWLLLQFAPIVAILLAKPAEVSQWLGYTGAQSRGPAHVDWLLLGTAVSVLLSLLPQIGEQVDYLRFLPDRSRTGRFGWWAALLATGPGWVVLGGLKLLAGSFLAVFALQHAVPVAQASQPTQMYYVAFLDMLHSPRAALAITGIFVIVCQLKINVTNAYAGSIAWSNFFSRLTHSHPGRVVWLVFNVLLALLLMEIGLFHAIEKILVVYANFAAGWIGALTADLVVNKPLGLSPRHIEFKRAHLYDINPVGVGSLLVSVVASTLAFFGLFGGVAESLSPLVGLLVAFACAPLIAWATGGRYYLARQPAEFPAGQQHVHCSICENRFERSDMATCPAYAGPICSLCCTLEARCHDQCKVQSRAPEQFLHWLRRVFPERVVIALNTRGGHFAGLLLAFNLSVGLLLMLIYRQFGASAPAQREIISTTLWLVFLSLLVLSGIAAWLIVLAHENRRAAEAESARQTAMLIEEISAHQRTDSELQKAKEVAESANLAKTRYLAGINHEIRTPLNSIFGYAQLLERGALGSTENAVRVIRRSAEHMVHLIDGLLDISKIETGLLRLNRDKVQLVELLDQMVDMFRLQAEARGLEFRYQRPPHLPFYVHTDQKRLRQVLINLLSNAIKYTDQGHAALTVRYRSQVAEFEISDTGMGIAPEDMERIFEPFERGKAPAVRALPGTGLGLTITKLLTQIMGGELLVHSVQGAGTRFVVRLMLSEAPADTHDSLRSRRVRGYLGPLRRILIVDDDPFHLELLRDLLLPLNFTVFMATDAAIARQLALKHQPDLVLMDLSLPDVSGWELARQLRDSASLEHSRLVIVSANAQEYRPGGDDALHDAFILKPIDTQALLECVGALLGLRWIHESPAGTEHAQEPASAAPQDRHHLDDLYQLGRIGHVRGIEAKLRQMEAENPSSQALTTQLRTLVSNFDLRQYMSVLEAMRKHG
ncbi:MAG TPA: ATP-binding protein [Steroidobacteraceae bacterium]|nr:ATP-binding protein [Steroidobacteraceae bacterium]